MVGGLEGSPSPGLRAGGDVLEHLADLGLLPDGGVAEGANTDPSHPPFCCGFVAGKNISNLEERGNELHFG